MKSSKLSTFIPIMLCFFAMGFVDLVGIASNFVKADLHLSESQANLFPSLVFFWFLIFSVPTGMLMNRIGQKNTVILSLVVTAASLLFPIFGNSYYLMLASFSLLGIGNAIMQTSLNPLISNIVSNDILASTLTFGQFVKAIASFSAPYIALWGTLAYIPSFGIGWRILFPAYMVIAVIAIITLGASQINESKPGNASSFAQCFALIGKPFILICFIGIMCHVGIDVGINATAPRILMERLGISLNDAASATSIYFIFRTFGCLSGSILLHRINTKAFFAISVMSIFLALLLLLFANSLFLLYFGIAMIGIGNSNVFSIIFSQALIAEPERKNVVSGLMIMGLFGGTIFPLAMGFASDKVGQLGSVAVMAIGAFYLLFLTFKINNAQRKS